MHATGMRMCIEAVYERSIETLNCSGYNHNWVRNYQVRRPGRAGPAEGHDPHLIGWFDGTAKNPNLIEPRNTSV